MTSLHFPREGICCDTAYSTASLYPSPHPSPQLEKCCCVQVNSEHGTGRAGHHRLILLLCPGATCWHCPLWMNEEVYLKTKAGKILLPGNYPWSHRETTIYLLKCHLRRTFFLAHLSTSKLAHSKTPRLSGIRATIPKHHLSSER